MSAYVRMSLLRGWKILGRSLVLQLDIVVLLDEI
jgi:hypothetical protein